MILTWSNATNSLHWVCSNAEAAFWNTGSFFKNLILPTFNTDKIYYIMATIINGVEKSPCICSKAKFALGISNQHGYNKKKCSTHYWNEVVDYFAKLHNVPKEKIEIAKNRMDLYK